MKPHIVCISVAMREKTMSQLTVFRTRWTKRMRGGGVKSPTVLMRLRPQNTTAILRGITVRAIARERGAIMAAKHIELAKSEGAKAGFKMWKMNLKRSGIPQVQDRYAELLAQGDVQAQFRYYCAQYGDQFGLTKKATRSQGRTSTKAAEPTPTNDLFAQFQAFLESQQGTVVEDEVDELDDEEIDEDAELDEIEEPIQAITTKRTTRKAAGTSGDSYAPKEPKAHATNGRLWKLNELGLLRVAKSPGDSITNGQAHNILKGVLS